MPFNLAGSFSLARSVGMTSEVLLAFVFMWPKKFNLKKLIALPLFFLTILLITLNSPESDFYNIFGMVLLRLLLFDLLIWFYYELTPKRCIYLGMIFFLLTQPARWIVTSIISYSQVNASAQTLWILNILSDYLPFRSCLILLFQMFVVWLAAKLNPIDQIETGNTLKCAMYSLLVLLYLYLRYDLEYTGFSESRRMFDLMVILFSYLAIILITVLTEYIFILQRLEEEQRDIIRLGQDQYQVALDHMHADSSVRQIYHDIHNHLTAISAISDDNQKVRDYVKSINTVLDSNTLVLNTGDVMLDSILSTKMLRAKQEQIAMSVCVNFRNCTFMDPVDVCAIFCNAVDNAIEASKKVQDPAKRRILLKADHVKGAVVIKISNYFDGEVVREGERLLTTKGDKDFHGIGISSIRYSARKYQGDVDISTRNSLFVMKILLPEP